MSDRPSLACELCPAKFGSAVALRFHVRRDHPGAYESMSTVFRRHEAEERRAKREQPGDLSMVDALYRMGCPCGRSYTQHVQARKELQP